MEAERSARLSQRSAADPGLSSQALAAEAEVLEQELLYNCEHVVPQSWFAKQEPMRGDLHHLFACEPDCNSFRGNTPTTTSQTPGRWSARPVQARGRAL